ncbi:MAG TPA: 1-pyrroline-5-carboxylate dehydrogenase, partial [Marmoricola sp.]|nr:1-pyrroline-5-carboxylate dehydrogenase [Marmoricola sp.]
MDAITSPPVPVNEPNLDYAPNSPERAAIETELAALQRRQLRLTATIGGRKRMGSGPEIAVVQPHNHAHVLG